MSYDDIENKWLFAGYSEKKLEEKDEEEKQDFRDKITKRKRVFAGSKGIGRFSADRLGHNLILYTRKERSGPIHKVAMDWDDFDDQTEDFEEIDVDYSSVEKIPISHPDIEGFKTGSVLEIYPLDDEWDRDKLVRLKRFLQRLINPTQIPGGQNEFKITVDAKEFLDEDEEYRKIRNIIKKIGLDAYFAQDKNNKKLEKKSHEIVNGEIKNIVFEKLKIETTQINCYVEEDKIITELIDKGNFVFKVEEENTYKTIVDGKSKSLHDIEIRVSYLNRNAKALFTRMMGIPPVQYGSIFLYRNGFRIQPLGDQTDDWLEVEAKKGQGFRRNLSRREIMGRVEVTGPQPGFKEVSSRDRGIVRTKEYDMLRELMTDKVIKWLTRYVVQGLDWDREEGKIVKTDEELARNSVETITKLVGQIKDPDKNIKFDSNMLNILKTREIDNFPNLVKNVRSIIPFVKPGDRKELETKLMTIERFGKKMTAGLLSYKSDSEAGEKEILFLKKTLGTESEDIQNYTHNILECSGNIEDYIDIIYEKIRNNATVKEISPIISQVSFENDKIKSLARFVTHADFKLKIAYITKDMIAFIQQYAERILPESFKRIRYTFLNQHLKFSTKFRPLEITTIIDNLVSNARKARASRMKIKFEIKDRKLHVFVGDNGKGVKLKYEKYIFKRGFTTTKEGSGIGLNHIQSTMESMGGTVKFIGNNYENLGSGACFELIFP